MFSPLAFPTGSIVYDLTTFIPPPSHLALSPFELYREPLVIIALADGAELDHVSYRENQRRSLNGNGVPRPEHNLRELHQDLEDLRDRYPKALVHQLLLFDYVHGKSAPALPDGLIAVPRVEDCKRTTLKTIMCDISSLLLAEMTTLAKSIQGMSSIESPTQSQISRKSNRASWGPGQAEMLSRRNSQFSLPVNSRSESPAGSTDRSQARMTMPARSISNSSISGVQSGTPLNGSASHLPTTFDEIVGNGVDGSNLQKAVSSRFVAGEVTRDSSRDRVSVQGFGSSSVSERARNKGKARVSVVIGSLYLCAGRWGDALKELVDGAVIAKINLDHLWHAKALENIIASMLMLAWAGLDFQIPQICYVSAEKGSSTPVSQDQRALTGSRLAALQNLTSLLPELVDRILNLYARAANNTGESLPQFPFSESVIRYTKLLSAIHLAGGFIDDDVLRLFVSGTPLKKVPTLSTPRMNIKPTRTEIVAVLYRAFPMSSSPDSLPVVDRIIILSGIASVLGSLGYYRKKAMVVREVVGVLIPGLVQARIKGAAEMGVHPAAGLAALNTMNGSSHGAGALDLGEGDIESGVDTFLGLLGRTYGVVASTSKPPQDGSVDDSNEAAIERIMQTAAMRSFGGHSLKMDVLRSCINLSEALPDFYGVLKFTADLLRTAGSGVAPGPRSVDASPAMTREEQVRLATNITRTLQAARNLGVKNISAEYWDEFLLRGVQLEALPPTRTPIPHSRNDLPGAVAVTASQEVNPFIYNPFLRTPDAAAADHVLIAGEGAIFRVTLQNPYDFDVEIENIKLESEGVEFESANQKTVIGSYRTQILTISGIAKSPGQLRITGCIIKVRGCRERRYPIFQDPWQPQREIKIKTIGVNTILRPKTRPISAASGTVTTTLPMTPPKAVSPGLNVIDQQPVVVVKSTTLSQSAVMILEGERQVFSITLQNLSKETSVDLLLFSFKDSTQAPLQTAMSNRDASPAEIYECELLFAQKQALRWKRKPGEKLFISPGGIATFDMEILGRPGLTSAVVLIDYAHLGVSPSEVQDQFHTRQVSLPITVTVNASFELMRMDVLPISGRIPRALWSGFEEGSEGCTTFDSENYCLLVLDLRNAWPCSLQIQLRVANSGTIDEEILPGITSRIMFPIQRIYIEDPAATIPVLDPSRQRQFVVSTSRLSADTERASREAFWYREAVLKMLEGSWVTKSGPHREGNIELRGIRLNPRMIEAVKIDEIGIEVSIAGSTPHNSKYQLITDVFSEVKVKISNRTTELIYPLVRIQPSIRNQPHNLTLDLSKKLAWNGLLQEALSPLPGNQTTEFSIGLMPLARGEFEISASVEESRLQKPPPVANNNQGRPRADTKTMMDAVLGVKERRIWHLREPCLVVVRDGDSDDDDDDDDDDE